MLSSLAGNLLQVEEAGFMAFGHRFSGRVANWRQDLIDLEREGVTYGDFVFDEEKGGPGLYRVDFTRTELYGYVRGVLGWDQFLAGGFDAVQDRSLAREAEKSAADRHEYDSGAEGVCAADFLGEEVENLVCGGRLDRVQRVRAADPGLEAVATVQLVAAALPTATKALTKRRKGKADFEIADEHDLQDLLYFALRSVFEDVRREEWTPSAAGGAKRVDLVIPDVRVMVEVKFVRNARHGRSIGDELKIDFESYHSHPACGTLIAVVWDPSRWLPDPQALQRELSGQRMKENAVFDVVVQVL